MTDSSESSKEMVYASDAAGIAALEVNPTDGTLKQIDFLSIREGGGMSVLPNGHYVLVGFSKYGFGNELNAIMLSADGRFSSEPRKLNVPGAIGMSPDGRFVLALSGGPPFDEFGDYPKYIKTYRLEESEDSLRAVEVASYKRDFCADYCYNWWEFAGFGESRKGTVLWLDYYTGGGLVDTSSQMEGYVISPDGSLEQAYAGFHGYGAGGTPFKNQLIGTNSGWDPMAMSSLDVDKLSLLDIDNAKAILWSCNQDSQSLTSGFHGCDSYLSSFNHAGNRIYFPNGYQPTQLWSMPFSPTSGPDYNQAVLVNPDSQPLQMISTSRDTDFLVIENNTISHSTELKVYHVEPTTGRPVAVTGQFNYEDVYSIAVH